MKLSTMSKTAAASVLGVALAGLALPAIASASPASSPSATATIQAACGAAPAGHARCQALRYTPVNGGTGLKPAANPSGYGPSDIQSAYQLPSAGNGVTVAIVDAYDDPNAEKDLGVYRSQYGLSACTTANGCFKKVNQTGGTTPPSGDTSWGTEITLDLDAVSAACPACKILLVEANDNNDPNLYAAVDEAVQLGAKYVSNSYSSAEDSSETGYDSHFNVPGVLFAFATGDNGYSAGTQYPAASRYALAVGGTSLTHSGGGSRGWSESAWSGAGSGCSAYEAQPSWQKNVVTACGTKRGESDISAVADPQTGIAVYDTYGQSGWLQYGGTSLATPLVTAMYALAGTPGANDNPASYPYAHTDKLTDVASGNNGTCGAPLCTARTGWDGPTGLGTPLGVSGLTGGTTTPPTTVTVANPGNKSGVVGTAVSLPNSASGGAAPYTWTATGLPTGLSISSSTGTISGTPSAPGTYNVSVTAKDSTGVTGTASFTWTITTAGTTTVTIANPGNQGGVVGTPANLSNSASGGKAPYTWTASGLPTGLSINASTGAISGTPSAPGTYNVTLTAKDANGVTGTASFTWTITAAGGGAATVTVTNPGTQYDYTGDRISGSIRATDSKGLPLTFTATGLPTGLRISSTGLVSGTITQYGFFNVTVTATDSQGARGSTSFTWVVYLSPYGYSGGHAA